jgi:glycosyltransferase involved in cell wall biosynthesis
MIARPLVSCIMIFLNGEKFIEEAIASIFAQTYGNWELLLVDDGSTDGSTDIAQRYAEQFPEKVRYIDHPDHQNRGMSATRNLGVAQAHGEYIGFLDCDDVWLPHKLDRQIETLALHPEASMVYGPTQRWYSWTGQPEDVQRDDFYHLGIELNQLIEAPRLLSLFLQGRTVTPCTCSMLFHHNLYQRVGGFEESWRGMYEDQVFFTKVCRSETVYIMGECLDKYRKHQDSCVSISKKLGQVNAVGLDFLHWQEQYLASQGIEDDNIWQSLHRTKFAYQHPRLDKLQKKAVSAALRLAAPLSKKLMEKKR